MGQLNSRMRVWMAGGLGLLAVLASGCSVAPPTAPQAGITKSNQATTLSSTTITWYMVASAWVDKGQAATVAGSRYQLQLVRGAMPSGAQVTLGEHDPLFCDVNIGPSGMAMSKTCSLAISYGGTNLVLNADQLKLYRYNEATGLWEQAAGTNDLTRQVFTGKVSVFGRYQLSPVDPGKGGW